MLNCIYNEKFGNYLIVFFGIAGYYMMMYSLLISTILSPIIKDMNMMILNIYMLIVIVITIIGFASIINFNSNDKHKGKRFTLLLSFSSLSLALFMTAIIPFYLNILV